MNSGADVNGKNDKGFTILHSAASKANLKIVKYLIIKGANIYAKNDIGWSVLHSAGYGGNLETLNYLISKGIDVNTKSNDGRSVLHEAAKKNNYELIEYLVSKGANVNAKDDDGFTVLHRAVFSGNLNIVKYLVSKGANVKSKTNDGRTVLSSAIFGGSTEVIEYLLTKGANRAELVSAERYWWWYCENRETCVDKMQIKIANNSYKPINSITFNLTIKDNSNTVLYRKQHTVKINLNHGEVGMTPEFKLANKVRSSSSITGDNTSFIVEMISVR